MSIVGKMSVGILRIDSTPPMTMSIAITTNVYGRRSAIRISHIEEPSVPVTARLSSCATVRYFEL